MELEESSKTFSCDNEHADQNENVLWENNTFSNILQREDKEFLTTPQRSMISGAYLTGSNQKKIIATFQNLNLKYKTVQRVINALKKEGL